MTTLAEPPMTTWAESSAQADAIRAKTAAEAAALEIERQLAEAEAAPKIAAAKARADRIAREAEEKRLAEEAEAAAAAAAEARVVATARRWRRSALSFALVCGIVALPLQILAFYTPAAPFLVIAPLVLEGGAWVLLSGAAAAIEDGRPTWHYRLIAGVIALFAAWINWSHGHELFGAATGAAGAFCSLAGPAVWDLHEHGRITKKQGKVGWLKRRQQQREAEKAATEKAARAAEEKARREAARAEEEKREAALATARREAWPETWTRATHLASALGSTTVTDQIWRRAWFDTYGTDVGETPGTIAVRIAARSLVVEAATAEDGSLVEGAEPLPTTASKAATALVRKGVQRPAAAAKKAPQKPLTDDELAKVRAKADELGGVAALSVAKVREAVGGGNNEHLVRLRDAVQAEAAEATKAVAA